MTAARAADKPVDWTGIYVGAHAGGAWGSSTAVEAPGFRDTQIDFDLEGFAGGSQIGYLWQTGPVVFGLEAQFSGADVDGKTGHVPNYGQDVVLETSIDWLFTATASLGYACDRWLVYAKGGYALAGTGLSVTSDPTFTDQFFSYGSKSDGWTVGGGAKYMIAPGWSIGAEYQFVRLEDDYLGGLVYDSAGNALSPNEFGFNTHSDIHTVSASLDYHF